ncbi:MAG: carbohydrate ABC transporter permease [Sphaerochaetaceae bacterium]
MTISPVLKRQRRKVSFSVYLLLTVLGLFYLFPIIWVFLSSFKGYIELFEYPPKFLPKSFYPINYIESFVKGDWVRYFTNTFLVTAVSTLICVVISEMGGYAFAKYNFKGRNFLFILFISTLMLPLEVLMIPIFIVIKKVGMYDSLWGLIIPSAATPFGIFLIRQFYLSIPNEYIDSARIDGAHEWQIFLRIMVPLGKSIMACLAIFSALWRWNDYLWPLLVIRNDNNYTLQLALANFSGQYNIQWQTIIAMMVLSMLPLLIIFLFFQKQIVDGMAMSGLKG